MIIKKLRKNKRWSQEQLAAFCGVSLRTIQRVEAGNKASLDTLKSLASVFEIDISKLTEEIMVIDKKADNWKSEPWWVRIGVVGIQKRSHMLFIEYALVAAGVVCSYITPYEPDGMVALLGAYISAKTVAYLDSKDYW